MSLKDMKLLLAIINTSLDDPDCNILELQEMISEAVVKLNMTIIKQEDSKE